MPTKLAMNWRYFVDGSNSHLNRVQHQQPRLALPLPQKLPQQSYPKQPLALPDTALADKKHWKKRSAVF